MELVSVVILNWNRRDDLREGLTRLREQPYRPIEVIVVDNGSSDDSVAMVQADFPEVKIIEIGANIGVEAYNHGFRQARGDYVVILDDDSFPAHDAIARMVERFREDPRLGVVAFDVRSYVQFEEWLRRREMTGEIRSAGTEQATGQQKAAEPEYYMSFNGAGAGVRRSVMEKAGYYPGEFFLYMNEMDMAFRIWDAGYRIRFFPDIISYHKASPTNRQSWRAPFFYTRNLFWLVWKNQPLLPAWLLTLRLFYYCVYFSLEQQTGIYLKAAWAAVVQLPMILRLRKPVRDEVARKLRVPYRVNFTFYR
ncbi:glycosyltransferase [Heliobacterium undosum]|uniref:Glycosyltransferase n=1 Tax=Heliomicrobium undosum TaxID=121734 RepID=A0A845L1F3_9FIRM|nr:glycosyltransferase family 2 protein [Heliomicrobium undosum]MZP29446.1 glycosyltransferase [Heliomicrobium undosum]